MGLLHGRESVIQLTTCVLLLSFLADSSYAVILSFINLWFGFLKLRIIHVLQPLIFIHLSSSPCDRFESEVYRKWSVISLSSSLVFLSQSHKIKEQGYEDTMMGSHPGGRVTACSVRCSILEYPMEMMVIFIFPLGSVSLGGFPGLVYTYIIIDGRPYSRTEGTALANGDWKYSENLRSTIEEHRPCHFRSSTIGGVTDHGTRRRTSQRQAQWSWTSEPVAGRGPGEAR
ncbi:hypothetical protein F2Q69_00035874 [Brassica cretica]|uniref:Uncharacterized protein n=1 Tax=Brassica cretica TaxID=69181 RepID=A0A8S9SJZ0_BRACR|nr:hypothetical protein F2Q69_00035874 [Brassica cretica]